MATHAPYNFVPLSSFVFTPSWGDQVSQDIPFKDGYSGIIDLTITAKTPLLIGGDRDKSTDNTVGEVKAFVTPDGKYAIPGSSLRGMIRNVLTIASFGKMNQVNDVRLGFRDLSHRKDYGEKFTNQVRTNFTPKSNAGYLNFNTETDEWEVTPCQYHRIEQSELDNLLPNNTKFRKKPVTKNGRPVLDRNRNPKYEGRSLLEKYGLWDEEKQSIIINNFLFCDERFHNHDRNYRDRNTGQEKTKRMRLWYGLATLGTGEEKGQLVFTGQPSLGDHSKHMEFVFHDLDKKNKIRIQRGSQIWKDFKLIYSDSESAEWKFLKEGGSKNPNGIPIFYLGTKTSVTALGLSQMFKIAYPNSIGDLIKTHSEQHCNVEDADLSELIFGHLNDDKKTDGTSLKARAHFGLAKCSATDTVTLEDAVTTVLNGPKASFYPNYLQQSAKKAKDEDDKDIYKLKNSDYNTFANNNARIRGWKRYPLKAIGGYPSLTDIGNKLKVEFKALPAGTVFKSRLHIHNMKTEEIGALIWALTWGGDTKKYHNIGMGKPYGMGRIELKIEDIALTANNAEEFDVNDVIAIPVMRDRFIDLMSVNILDWKKTQMINELLSMASDSSKKLDYMNLKDHASFKGKYKKYVLPAHDGTISDAPEYLVKKKGEKFAAGDWVKILDTNLIGQIVEITTGKNPGIKFPTGSKVYTAWAEDRLTITHHPYPYPKKQPNT